MIEEPPLLEICGRSSRPRPAPKQLVPFQDAPLGNITDAMNGVGALDPAIKPLPGLPYRMIGPALPVWCGPAEILGLLAALTELDPGDVVVVATDDFQGAAAVGDMVSGMLKNGGAAGLVTDGMVRDLDGLEMVGLPLFAKGLNPNSPYDKGPGKVGYPVVVGGRTIGPGDLVIGDRDGVVVVPFDQIDAVASRLDDVRAAEAALEARVKDGLAIPEDIADLVNGPGVKRS